MARFRLDPAPLASAVLAAVMLGVYVGITRSQDDGGAALWFVVLLTVGIVCAGLGAVRGLPGRVIVLTAATAVLGLLGMLGLLTIGFPILLAAALSGLALVRAVVVRGPAGTAGASPARP